MATNQRLHAALERGKEKSTWYSCVSQINDGIRMGDEKGRQTQKEVGGIGKGLHLRSERYWGKGLLLTLISVSHPRLLFLYGCPSLSTSMSPSLSALCLLGLDNYIASS